MHHHMLRIEIKKKSKPIKKVRVGVLVTKYPYNTNREPKH